MPMVLRGNEMSSRPWTVNQVSAGKTRRAWGQRFQRLLYLEFQKSPVPQYWQETVKLRNYRIPLWILMGTWKIGKLRNWGFPISSFQFCIFCEIWETGNLANRKIRIPSFLIFNGKVGNLEIGFAKGGRGEGSAAVRAMGQRGWARMCLGPAGAKIKNLGNSKILIPMPKECWN